MQSTPEAHDERRQVRRRLDRGRRPSTWVETKAGTPILDASPAAVQKLFPGVGSLGWSDLKKNPGKYSVTAVKTSLPLGPCNATSAPARTDACAHRRPILPRSRYCASAGRSRHAPADPATGPACSGDGACNPGSDGSGKICESGHCVDGCRSERAVPRRDELRRAVSVH